MKRTILIALVLALVLTLFAGCRRRQEDMNNGTDTTATQPGSNMLPDANDRIDPTNGANKDTTPATTRPTVVPDTVPDTMPGTTPDNHSRSRQRH